MSPSYSVDWFSSNITVLEKHLGHIRGKGDTHGLEIGSFEGRSTKWFLDTILTHETSTITCVDTFEGSPEHSGVLDTSSLYEKFNLNLREEILKSRVQVYRKRSIDFFLSDSRLLTETFDFVYIDGSHKASDVLIDAVHSFRLVKQGGLLIFDDYEWPVNLADHDKPKLAVDAFIACHVDECYVLHAKDLCIVQKR